MVKKRNRDAQLVSSSWTLDCATGASQLLTLWKACQLAGPEALISGSRIPSCCLWHQTAIQVIQVSPLLPHFRRTVALVADARSTYRRPCGETLLFRSPNDTSSYLGLIHFHTRYQVRNVSSCVL